MADTPDATVETVAARLARLRAYWKRYGTNDHAFVLAVLARVPLAELCAACSPGCEGYGFRVDHGYNFATKTAAGKLCTLCKCPGFVALATLPADQVGP